MADENKPTLHFEPLEVAGIPGRFVQQPIRLFRASVPGGWLVLSEGVTSHDVCFVPDPEHRWDGKSTT